MTTKKSTDNITLLPYPVRVKLVQQRLSDLRYGAEFADLPKSAKVAAAFAVVAEWEKRNNEHHSAQRKAHRARLAEVQDALIIGDTVKAVALLKKLEANN